MKDFFISYNKADRSWAEWIAWQLEEMGCSVTIQAWDFGPGCNFILEMDKAAKETERTIAVLSPDFLKSIYTQLEWAAALVGDPTGADRKLLPIRVRDCKPDGLLAAISYTDLVGLNESAARDALRLCQAKGRAKPHSPPPFPHEIKPSPFPGSLPERSDPPSGSRLPFSPNAVFTGRQEDLLELAKALLYSDVKVIGLIQSAAVATGYGGIGKTQLAVEFCYRYGRFFQGVHWINADQDIPSEIAACGYAMALPGWPDKVLDQVSLTLKAWSESRPQLVILDNAIDTVVVQDWMPRFFHCRLLITSRQQEWPPDMGLKIWPLNVMTPDQCRELLCKLAPRLAEASPKDLNDMAERLGHLPLAVDLAGRYLKDRPNLSPKDYLNALESQRNALDHTSLKDWTKHNPTRHDTSLAATFTLSWKRLDSSDNADDLAKRIFRACGYCSPGTPVPSEILRTMATQDDTGEMLDKAIGRLSSLGLIILMNGMPTIHTLLAEFARLQDLGAEESILPELADAVGDLVNQALKSSLPEKMEPLRKHLRSVAQAAEEAELQVAGTLWSELGYHLHDMAEYENARKYYERALKIDEKAFGPDHPSVAMNINNIGLVLKDLGDLEGARKYLERALKIDEKVHGPDHPSVAMNINNIGSILQDLGDLEGARKYLERALKIDEKIHGPDHPDVAADVNNIGLVLKDLGDLEGARKYLERALKIDEKVHSPDHPNVARDINNIGSVLKNLGDLEGARKYLERALKIDEKVYGPDHHNVAIMANNLGVVLQDLGDLEGARKYLERALKIDEKVYGPDHPRMAIRVSNLGMVLQELGDLEGARKCFERALKIDEKVYDSDHPRIKTIKNNLESLK